MCLVDGESSRHLFIHWAGWGAYYFHGSTRCLEVGASWVGRCAVWSLQLFAGPFGRSTIEESLKENLALFTSWWTQFWQEYMTGCLLLYLIFAHPSGQGYLGGMTILLWVKRVLVLFYFLSFAAATAFVSCSQASLMLFCGFLCQFLLPKKKKKSW